MNLGSAAVSRRNVLLVAAMASAGLTSQAAPPVAGSTAPKRNELKALAFDVYGTCTDYWTAFVHEGEAINRAKGLSVDWSALLAEMGGPLPPTFVEVFKKQRPWQSFTSLRRESLDKLVRQKGLELSDSDLAGLNGIWERAEPWPDVVPGIDRLRPHFVLTTLGNADMGATARLAKHGLLPFDMILTAELAQSVKPDPSVYQLAPRLLGLKANEILMVACHKADLRGAANQGLRTAYIARPLEAGPTQRLDTKPEAEFDFNAVSFQDLATQLLA